MRRNSRKPTNGANGLTRDTAGPAASRARATGRRVIREEHDGTTTVIAGSFQGRRLNRPNDVVVKSDGAIYFTDPWTGTAVPDQTDLTYAGVYRVSPDLGTLTLPRQRLPHPQRPCLLAGRKRALH